MISIAMATYSGEKYLREQLDSILAQTITDWELIICDDCSKDSTVEILTSYQEQDDRIKIFVNEKNLGFKKNFEKAIGLCSGDYIALADQDDIWHENHLEVLYNEIEEHFLVCSNVSLIDSSGRSLHKNLKPNNYYVSSNREEQFLQLLHNNYVQGCTTLFKRELLQFILPIPDYAEYHDYWIAFVASLYGNLKYIPETTLLYRRHESVVTGQHNRSRKQKIWDLFNTGGEFYQKRLSFLTMLEYTQLQSVYAKLYKDAKLYYSSLLQGKNKIWCISYFIKNYRLIFCSKNNKFFLIRLLKWHVLVPLRTMKDGI